MYGITMIPVNDSTLETRAPYDSIGMDVFVVLPPKSVSDFFVAGLKRREQKRDNEKRDRGVGFAE